MVLDRLPIWGLFLATCALVGLALEAGFRLGRRRQRLGGGKSEVSGAMVVRARNNIEAISIGDYTQTETKHLKTAANVPGPVPGAPLSKEYVATVGRCDWRSRSGRRS